MSKLLCTLCKSALKNNDDVYSTSCGHIFHFLCLSECQSRSTCCPECQHFNATTYKLYLTFDESEDEQLPNDCNDNFKIVELHKELEESNAKYEQLQDKYLDSVRKLEERLKVSNRSIAQRAVVHAEFEERIKTLEELNEYLTIDNDCKSKALTEKLTEIEKLQKTIKDLESSGSVTSQATDYVKKLEQKMESLTLQLDNEIANSTILSIDNKKLLKYVELMKTDAARQLEYADDHSHTTLTAAEDITENQQNSTEKNLNSEEIEDTNISQNSADKKDSIKQTISRDDSKSCTDISSVNIILPNNELKYQSQENSLNKNFKLTRTEKMLQIISQDEEFKSYNSKTTTETFNKVTSSNEQSSPRNSFETQEVFLNKTENDSLQLIQQNELKSLNDHNSKNTIETLSKASSCSVQTVPYNRTERNSSQLMHKTESKPSNDPNSKTTSECVYKTVNSSEQILPQNSSKMQEVPDNKTGNYNLQLMQQNELKSFNDNNSTTTTATLNKVSTSSVQTLPRNPFKTEEVPKLNCQNEQTLPRNPFKNEELPKNQKLPNISEENSINNNNSVLITNFPKNKIQYPLKNFIFSLPSTQEGCIYVNDINKVQIKDRNGKKHQQLPPKLTVFVEFKNHDIKSKFLLNQVQIRQLYPSVEIIDPKEGTLGNSDVSKEQSIKSAENLPKPASSLATEKIPATVVNTISNSSNNLTLLINNFPKNKLKYPLKNLIVSLASTKEGCIYTNDVYKVFIKDHNGKKHYQLPQQVNLIVEFKNIEVKNKFLMNRAQIQQVFPNVELMDTINENSTKLTNPVTKSLGNITTIAEEITTEAGSKNPPTNELNSSNSSILIIENFPKQELQYPIKTLIITMASTKEGYITENDIGKAYIKDRNGKKHHQLPQNVVLIVEFKNSEVKSKFLLNLVQIFRMFPNLKFKDVDNEKGENEPKKDQSAFISATTTSIKENPSVAEVIPKNLNGPQQRDLSHKSIASNNNFSAVNAMQRHDSNSQVYPPKSLHLATNSFTNTRTKEMSASTEIIAGNYINPFRQEQRSVASARYNDQGSGQRQRSVSSARCNDQGPGQSQRNSSSTRISTNNNFSRNTTTNCNDLRPLRQRSNSVQSINKQSGATRAFSKRDNNKNNFKPQGKLQRSASLAKLNKTSNATRSNNNLSSRFNTTNWNDLRRQGHQQNSATKHNGPRQQRSSSLTRSTGDTRTNRNSRSTTRNNPQNSAVNSLKENPPTAMTAAELADKYAVRHGYRIKDVSSNAMQSAATFNIASATAIEDLLIYAREKLRGNGFEYVFRQNNEVRALRDRNDFEGIKIMNTVHVNELLLSHNKK